MTFMVASARLAPNKPAAQRRGLDGGGTVKLVLKQQAQAARVDALLLLGRRSEALGLLEQTTFTRLPRGGELTVLRGELRAASGR